MERTEHDTDGEASETIAKPDTDTEEQLRELGMVWMGCYPLAIGVLAGHPGERLDSRKRPLRNSAPRSAPLHQDFRKVTRHQCPEPPCPLQLLPQSQAFCIMGCSMSPLAQLTVNGGAATRGPYHLDQCSTRIRISKLKYNLGWTEFAATNDFKEKRNRYVTRSLGC
jgi:hypothetical protein